MNSIWSGTVEDSFFDGEAFERARKLQLPEKECSSRPNPKVYYVLGVDVGRKGCETVVTVIKVTEQLQGPAFKSLVNLYVLEDWHFEDQAIFIKKIYGNFKARTVVIDANGLINIIAHVKFFELLETPSGRSRGQSAAK